MVPVIAAPRDLRCIVESDDSSGRSTVTLRPVRSDYVAIVLLPVISVLTIGFFTAIWRGVWDISDWMLIGFVSLSAAALSFGLLCKVMVRRFEVGSGELTVDKSVLGIRRHFRIENGLFEMQRIHSSKDFQDDPYAFELEVIEPTGNRVRLVYAHQWDRRFAQTLSEFLTGATGWSMVEKRVYSPPSESSSWT